MARSQALTPLGATALEHQSPGLCTHPLSETMRLGAPPIVRLKCTFHSNYSLMPAEAVIEKRETNNRLCGLSRKEALQPAPAASGKLNSRRKFPLVTRAISARLIPCSSASTLAVSMTKAGSFRLPR